MSNKSGPQPYNRRLLSPNVLGYAPFGEDTGAVGSEVKPDHADPLHTRTMTNLQKAGARKKKVLKKKKTSLSKKKSVTKKKKSVVKRKKSVVKRKKSVTKKKKSVIKRKKSVTKRKKSTRR